MKKITLLFALAVLTTQVYAQAPNEVLEVEKTVIAKELEKAAESGNHDKKTMRLMKKVAGELKKLDDCPDCKEKTKSQIILRNVGRKLGKGSAWVSTTTSKPFLNATGFLTGAFEKKEKNQTIAGLYTFFLNHTTEFDKLYLEANSSAEFAGLLFVKLDGIVKAKNTAIIQDFIKTHPDIVLTEEELKKESSKKILADFINSHPEYQEIRGIIGEVSSADLVDVGIVGDLEKSFSYDLFESSAPRIHEGIATIVGQIFAPKIVLGVVSSTVAGLYAAPVALADVGTAISTAVCVQDGFVSKVEKDDSDKDLAEFCSYVVNRSAYELMKSRARGYVAGKKTRSKIENRLSK